MKYLSYVKEKFSGTDFPIFTVADIRTALKRGGISADYTNLLLHDLAKKGITTRVTRGVYTFHKDIAVVGFAFSPFYYGLESALSLRGISDQGTNMVVITARNVRTGIRTFAGRNYRIQRIGEQYMFGYSMLRYGDYWVPVSDPEKTLIDMAAIGVQVTDEELESLRKLINKRKLTEYLKRYDDPVLIDSIKALGMPRA